MSNYGMLVVEWPMVLGCDASGVVVEVGEGVEELKEGDGVCGCSRLGHLAHSTCQEYVCACVLCLLELVMGESRRVQFCRVAVVVIFMPCLLPTMLTIGAVPDGRQAHDSETEERHVRAGGYAGRGDLCESCPLSLLLTRMMLKEKVERR